LRDILRDARAPVCLATDESGERHVRAGGAFLDLFDRASATVAHKDVGECLSGLSQDADVATINGIIAQVNSLITQKAEQNGYAIFSLGAIYDGSKNGLPFDLNQLLTSTAPFGPLIGLDGIHPSPAGHTLLAAAAKTAITQKYGRLSKQ